MNTLLIIALSVNMMDKVGKQFLMCETFISIQRATNNKSNGIM